ncbi:MAG: hypothetical protein ACRELY_19140, partial [Polyangiaceae bacterium]
MKLRTIKLRRLAALAVPVAVFAYTGTAFAQGSDPAQAPAADPAPAPAAADPAPATTAPAPAPAPPDAQPAGPSGAPDQGLSGASTVDQGVGLSVEQKNKDEAQAAANPSEEEEDKIPIRGSTFLFDQSVTTNTAHLESSQQLSYVPTYEWWLSFRPRWYFTDHLYYTLRADYYKEFTNSNQTTNYREDVFGDVWNTLGWKSPISEKLKDTKYALSVQALLPTSKESQDAGVYVTVGAGAGIS